MKNVRRIGIGIGLALLSGIAGMVAFCAAQGESAAAAAQREKVAAETNVGIDRTIAQVPANGTDPGTNLPPDLLAEPQTQEVAGGTQNIIETPLPDAPATSPAPVHEFIEVKTATPPGATVEQSAAGSGLITVALDETPLADVIRMFTRISGANIIASATNLHGTVTVNLQDVEWKPALAAILDMHDLILVEKVPASGVYSIIPKAQGGPEPQQIVTIPLRYASVSNVAAVVSSLLLSNSTVSAYPSRNSIVIRSTSASLASLQKVIESIDLPQKQVFIEAKFMELTDGAIKDLGINWQSLQAYQVGVNSLQWQLNEQRQWNKSSDARQSDFDKRENVDTLNKKYDMNSVQFQDSTAVEEPAGSGNFVTKVTPTRTVVDTIDKGKNITSDLEDQFIKTITDARSAVLSAGDFSLILSALKQHSGVSVVSNPKIIVANEETALIHIGNTERPFISSVTPGQQGIAPVVTYNPGDPVDFGVKLQVTPTVNTEEQISVRIEPELTRFVDNATAPNGQTYPIIARKTIRTIFSLGNGKTAAIGGLTETDERDEVTSIPMLGDIPILGKYLFSHTHKQKTQDETIIFVTVGIANATSIERNAGLPEDTELARKHILTKELEKKESAAPAASPKSD